MSNYRDKARAREHRNATYWLKKHGDSSRMDAYRLKWMGVPRSPRPSRPAIERLWSRIVISDDGCWGVSPATHTQGYATVSVAIGDRRKVEYAHRVMYEFCVGPIPSGLQIDHLCRNRACCNPAHLEVVTPQVNTARGQSISVRNARKTHCPRGHELRPNPCRPGTRYCLKCKSEQQRRYNAKKVARGEHETCVFRRTVAA